MNTIRRRRPNLARTPRRRIAVNSDSSKEHSVGSEQPSVAGRARLRKVAGVLGGILLAGVTAIVVTYGQGLVKQAPGVLGLDYVTIEESSGNGDRAWTGQLTPEERRQLLSGQVDYGVGDDSFGTHDIVPVGRETLAVGLVGRGPGQVVISGVSPVIVGPAQPPIHDIYVEATNQGANPPEELEASLDSVPTVFVDPNTRKPYEKSITLDPGERIKLLVTVTTTTRFYKWELRLDLAGGRSNVIRNAGDRPFMVTAGLAPDEYDHYYQFSGSNYEEVR